MAPARPYIAVFIPPDPLDMKYVPNALTIGRIVVTPLLLALLLSDTLMGQAIGLVLFILAAISDYLDGKIARSYQVRSRLGQFLDPFADKVLVLGTFIVLIFLLPEVVPWWAVALIALRDLAVTAMRSWAEAHGRSLRTLPIARAKTAVQLTFLIVILLVMILAKVPGDVGAVGAWILASELPFIFFMLVVVFTVLTGLIYMFQKEFTKPLRSDG